MALLFLGWLGARFRRALGKLLLPLACLELYLLTWAMIYFLLAGKQLSLSAIYGDWTRNLLNVGLWSVLALGVVGVAVGYVCARDGIWMVARHLGNTSLLTLAVLLLFAGLFFAISGIPAGRLPDPGGWSILLIALAQVGGVGLGTPVAMLIGALVAEVVARGR